jgi:SMI1 / KNR4 family (SUKH-1)
MDESLISMIRNHVAAKRRSIPFPPVSEWDIEEAETQLQFSIPSLLKSVYVGVGNGGFGPGRGGSIIGLEGGYASDFGTLVETYKQLKEDQALEGKQWKADLLPFCEWGCNIFSCVDCKDLNYPIYLFEDGDVIPKGYTLQDFFNLWLEGVDILSYEGRANETAEVTNPFTGHKTRVTKQDRER